MKINWKQVAMFGVAGALVSLVVNLAQKPDTIDFVNVALVPELAEHLGADLQTRLELANTGYLALNAIKGPPGTPTLAGKQADQYGRQVLGQYGQQAFDLLTVEQRKQFYNLFRSREVKPVTYRTEPPPSGSGPAMFRIEFGWQKIDASMHASLPQTAANLEHAWEMIPSKVIAESLADDSSAAVSMAANKWLAEHAPPPEKKRQLDGPYSEDQWARHDRAMAEVRRNHESQFADPQRNRDLSANEPLPSYEQRVAEMKRQHEERVAKMKREQPARLDEMRRQHEQRVSEMKKTN